MTKALKESDDINEPGCDLARIHVKYIDKKWRNVVLFNFPLMTLPETRNLVFGIQSKSMY